jgi:CRISPR/Cas system-associated exonuclease Cas4 (RecB family)
MPVKLEGVVHSHMVKKALENSRRFSYFHPSAWGQCLRKISYQYYNEQKPFLQRTSQDVNDKGERVFDNGHSMHDRWSKYLDHAGVLRGAWRCTNSLCGKVYGGVEKHGILNPSAEQKWKCACGSTKRLAYQEIHLVSDKKYNFEGHCDGVIDVRGTDFAQGKFDMFVVDFKSAKDETFCELTEPKREHVVQVNIYMWLLELDAAVVLYENKNTQNLKEFFVPRDDKLIENIKEKAVELQEILAAHKLPPRPSDFSRSKFPCFLCEFVRFCW